MRKLLFSLLLGGLGVLAGCGGSGSGGGGGNTTVTLVSIQVTPATPSIGLGKTQQFTATGSYSDGTTKNLTTSANWLSSSTAIATISISGTATAVAPGTTTITATSGAVSGTTTLTVANPLVSIAVTPGSASVAPNGTQQFTATGTFADGTMQNITSSVTWSASTGATITAAGVATGVTPNATATIMANQGSVSGSAMLTVTDPVVSIAVTSANSIYSIPVGITLQFVATATLFDGTSRDITHDPATAWTSSDPTVATVSNLSPTQGLATSIKPGPTMIEASSGGVAGSASLTVNAGVLTGIAIAPKNMTISLRDQQPYQATGTYTTGPQQDVTNSAVWSSSAPTVATITTGGFATGLAPGSTTVSATLSGQSDSTTLTVNADNVQSIAITPNAVTLAQGTSQQLTATATLLNGSTLNIASLVTWSTSDPNVAPVSTGGVVRAGTVAATTPETVTATLTTDHGPVAGTLSVNITPAIIVSVRVTPINPTIAPGTRQGFVATGAFNDGSSQTITNNCTWSSDNHGVATTSGAVVTGVATGTAHIAAAFTADLTKTDSTTLTVSSATLVSFSISPSSAFLAPSTTQSFSASGTFSDGTNQALSGSALVWSTTNSSVVTIISTGLATGQKAGNAVISATYNGMPSTNTAPVLVESTLLQTINVTPSSATVPETISTAFAANGVFGDGSQQNVTSFVTWASTPPSVATISNTGRATGLSSVGSPATITATFEGVVGTAALTVTPATLTSIAVSPLSSTIAVGSNLQFIATGTFSDLTTVNLTSQVTWSSSDVTKVVIGSSTGLATATGSTATGPPAIISATLNGQKGLASVTVP